MSNKRCLRLLPQGSLCALLFAFAPDARLAHAAASEAPVPQETGDEQVFSKAPDGTPRLLLGNLSPAAPGLTVEQAGQGYLEKLVRVHPDWVPSELSPGQVLGVGPGHVLRFAQTHHGLPVWGGELSLRLLPSGQVVRLFRSVVPQPTLDRISPRPSISAEDAARGVAALGEADVGQPVLGVDAKTQRLVYRVSRMNLRQLEQADYLVDAHSGEIVRRIDHLKFLNQFAAYRYNPATTSNTEQVSLPEGDSGPFAPAGAGSRPMTSTLLRSVNCLDDFKLRTPGTGGSAIHLCSLYQSYSNSSGDYHLFPPLVGASDGRCPTINDTNRNWFGEAHMYWHSAAVYAHFRTLFSGLGTSDFKLAMSTGGSPQPFPLLTNLCMPGASSQTNPNVPLQPFENAFFSPGEPGGGFSLYFLGYKGDMIAFGMGAKANYSMDADVIYHEFTHAMVSSRKRLVESLGNDPFGLNDDPGAMNEGLSDYFSSTLTGDSVVGEYAKTNLDLPTPGMRDLNNTLHCSNDRVGEVHEDANPWSGALWRARLAVTGDPKDPSGAAQAKRKSFDEAVLAALEGSVPMPTMAEMGKLVVDEVRKRTGALGQDAEQKTTDALTLHGVLSQCDRVIRVQTPHKMLCLDSDGKKLWPGHAQWKIDLPYTADTVQLDFKTLPAGAVCNKINPSATSQAPGFQVAVRMNGEPVMWDNDLKGTYDQLVPVQQGADSSIWSVKVTLVRGRTHHLMLVNSGGPRIAKDITVTTSCAAADGCPEPPPPSKSGCQCDVGQDRTGSGLALAVAGLLAAGLLRRRRQTQK